MNVLVIKNVFSEGPGTMADHLAARGVPVTTFDLSIGERAPDLAAYTHLLVMGGPMAVYEMDQYPYLADEAKLIDRALKADLSVLGVCLGAQMLAHVLGARVFSGGKKEIGWYDVALTADGMDDPCMRQLAVDGQARAEVFQWHGDTFALPAGSPLLASSDLFPHQAFRYGDRAYGLQFHIEVTPAIVAAWLAPEKGIDHQAVASTSERIYSAYRKRADGFYGRFFST